MVFCNTLFIDIFNYRVKSHNPYFSRWFSAMVKKENINTFNYGHNPYFSRWFSAIGVKYDKKLIWEVCHNPYFSRWFSAINKKDLLSLIDEMVTILILVDGFLQLQTLSS